MDVLDSAKSVIEALGGTNAAQEIVAAKTPSVVCNWRSRGRFPARTYCPMIDALARLGKTANPELWGLSPASGGRSFDDEARP